MQHVLSEYGAKEVRDTSKAAIREFVGSGELEGRYKEYLDALADIGVPSTDREVCWHTAHGDPNYFRPRRNELVHLGIIRDAGVRSCTVSHKMCHVWWFVE